MRKVLLLFLIAVTPSFLVACATASTVRNAPLGAGTSKDFAAPYAVVKAAALEAVQRLNVDNQGGDETEERFQIRFSKHISAFSWGEVGVVNVVRLDSQKTRVFVNSEKRSQMQITGTTEKRFAEQIFANITQALPRLEP
jgi:hypothetical protein